jgi:hypothetical protein
MVHQHGIDVVVAALRGLHGLQHPGTPGRFSAGLAAVRARGSLTMASLSFRNCASCASFSGMNTIGSPPDDTMRCVSPTTV